MNIPRRQVVASAALSAYLAVGLIAAASALPASALAATVGSGNMQSQTRSASDFQAISLSGSMDLVVRQTGKENIEVHGDDNLLPLVETVVEQGSNGRTLKIRWKSGESIRTRSDTVVTVDVKDVKAVAAAGSGDVTVESLKTPTFTLSLSGSSDAKLQALSLDHLSVSVSGSGDVSAAGAAAHLSVRIAGSGDVTTSDLQSDEVSVVIAGSGDASVVANKSLDVSIAGSGDVTYSGNPASVHQSVAGSGSVHKR